MLGTSPSPSVSSTSGPYVTVLVGTLLLLQIWVNVRQPKPYMDELFHVPQAQRFCSASIKFTRPSYDSTISTPPGLYLPNALIAGIFRTTSVCSTASLRFSSAIATMLSFFVTASIFSQLRRRSSSFDEPVSTGCADVCGKSNRLSETNSVQKYDYVVALVLVMMPLSFFYTTLYYTEAPAMLYVLLAWDFSLRGRSHFSALFGILASLTRQTNMFWHFFIAADALLFSVLSSNRFHSSRSNFRRLFEIVDIGVPHMISGLLYVCFLYFNGGAAVGDKNHHVPMIHYSMLPYFFFFHSVAHGLFHIARPTVFMDAFAALFKAPLVRASVIGIAAILTAFISSTSAYAHPFSLADNRHFMFYLYRKWLLRSPFHRHVLVPFYLWTPLSYIAEVRRVHGAPRYKLYCQCVDVVNLIVILTVMLHPLLEPRYFIIPSIILSLRRVALLPNHLPFSRLHLAVGVFVIANIALVYVFAERPFPRVMDHHMPHDQSPGRLML